MTDTDRQPPDSAVAPPSSPGRLESHLRARRDEGRKLLVPYITAGYPDDSWALLLEGLAAAGADAIEIGVPFSDPVMDGPTIQESSTAALERGMTPELAFSTVARQNP
ncbi:MAG: tryptophan synthase subunit alpha, partial [Acidimicrobiia bacterium]|nr:tryptophan synthase subunit alpha [Acidimicrobiia bacterium]